MRNRVRNEPDSGPAADGAMVTYSRVPRGGRPPAEPQEPFERQEPYLDAREVPYQDDDLRAYDPERAPGGLDGVVDDLDVPRGRRGRGRRRGGGRVAVLIGALALAAGMVILAYAYGIATRVEAPSPLSAGMSTTGQDGAGTTRGTLSADDAARSIPVKGEAPAAALAPSPQPAAPQADTGAAQPPAESAKASPPGAAGVPMDGDAGQPTGGAQPALVAPVPATATPAAPGQAAAPPAKAANAPPAAGSTDDLMTNIERLLTRDGATAGASGQPGDGSAASAGPTSLAPALQPAGSDGLPPLPDPNAVANAPAPTTGPQAPNRLIPPADIPNVPPSDASTGDPNAGLGTLH